MPSSATFAKRKRTGPWTPSLPYLLRLPTVVLFLFSLATPATADSAVDDDGSLPCIAPSLKLPSGVTGRPDKVVIAHRGASAHLPEHTLPGYRLAMELGADYIEPDLVVTRDRQLVAVHSMDLNITTDVAEKFPDRIARSSFLDRDGYFVYNFDLDEIQTLRVRQRLPTARSKAFDGLFGVPTFAEILDLLSAWNNDVDPLLVNSTARRAGKGVYVELKDYLWLKQDADMDILDVFFEHINANYQLWQSAVLNDMCFRRPLRVHEFALPPLVVQSFEIDVLQQFTERWKQQKNLAQRPVPPRTLLVDTDKCLEEKFWANIGQSWHKFIDALGPDKACLRDNWQRFMVPAIEHELVVHPWTQRPELEFIESVPEEERFESVIEETMRLFCTAGIDGVFSEAPSTTLLAASMCDKTKKSHSSQSKSGQTNSLCYESETEANIYVGTASFVMGAFLASLVALWQSRRPPGRSRGRRHLRIPTVEAPDDELEMM